MASEPVPLLDAGGALVALDGRRLGRRAQATRRKLLDATAELLQTRRLLDLTVVEVARRVGTSPASFYQYFQNVDEAVLALAAEIGGQLAGAGADAERVEQRVLRRPRPPDRPEPGADRRQVDGHGRRPVTVWNTMRATVSTMSSWVNPRVSSSRW